MCIRDSSKTLEDKQIPASFDFTLVPSLRTEARQKFAQIRPATLGQASRIPGVSPADISSLTIWLTRSARAKSPGPEACAPDGDEDLN